MVDCRRSLDLVKLVEPRSSYDRGGAVDIQSPRQHRSKFELGEPGKLKVPARWTSAVAGACLWAHVRTSDAEFMQGSQFMQGHADAAMV